MKKIPDKYALQWRYVSPHNAQPWKIMFLESGLLVCENRLRETGKTFFTCLELGAGKEILKDFSLDDRIRGMMGGNSMTGLETTRGTLFYIHGYQGNSPEHSGLWAVDPLEAEVIWARPEAVFVANLRGGMLVYAAGSFAGFPERSYFLLDTESGEVLDTIGEDAARANSLRRESLSDEELQQVVLPEIMSPDRLAPGLSGEGFSEYIEQQGLLITVIHMPTKDSKGFDATIRVYHNDTKVYEDVLARGTAVPCVNYFLLRDVTLYYIRNMNELIAVHL